MNVGIQLRNMFVINPRNSHQESVPNAHKSLHLQASTGPHAHAGPGPGVIGIWDGHEADAPHRGPAFLLGRQRSHPNRKGVNRSGSSRDLARSPASPRPCCPRRGTGMPTHPPSLPPSHFSRYWALFLALTASAHAAAVDRTLRGSCLVP